VQATNVSLQVEDCQQSSFADATFDTAFISLLLHFTAPARTVREMHRLLRAGGTLLVVNLDPEALTGLDRVRSVVRILLRGIVGYRVKPPARFGRNVLTERQLADLLTGSGFRVTSTETVHDPSRSSHMPREYVRGATVSPRSRDSVRERREAHDDPRGGDEDQHTVAAPEASRVEREARAQWHRRRHRVAVPACVPK
jgi:SAM-dependent methyltransferase